MGIGNLMSSHSLSAGHVPLGLGRDRTMQDECKNKMMINNIIPKNTNRISISYPQWSRHCRRRGLARA